MIVDLEKASIAPSDFDVCILGSGAAGLVLAASLAQRGIRTLVLEAGGRRYNARNQDPYWGEVESLPYDGLYDGRFRVLGGTTTQWAGQVLEIDDFVFDERPWVTGSGWPFSKSALTPYYKAAAKLEGLADAPENTDDIWRALGLSKPEFGPDLISAFSKFCPQTNFAKIYSDALHRQPNPTVCLHANAVELVTGNDETTITGVRCRTLEGWETIFKARTFVLCMGGIENCRFLLQPRKDGSVPIWNRHGMIGRHYQDHLSCHVADIVEQNADLPDIYLDFVSVGGYRYQQKMKLPPETQKRLGTLDISGFVTYFTRDYDDMARAYETIRWLRTHRYEKLDAARLMHLAGNFHKMLWHRFPYSRAIHSTPMSARRQLKLCINCEQSPLSDGKISLSSQRDALGLLRVKVDWRASDHELHSIRSYVGVAQKAFEQNGIGRIVPFASLHGKDDEIASTFKDIFHHIGGTRMATSDKTGAVNPDLQLFGTRNVYVCGTSVIPSAGFANPTHTVIALALRLADHLKRGFSTELFAA